MDILHLPLKSKWYLMIELRIKKEEYRVINDYWLKRLTINREEALRAWAFCQPELIRFKQFAAVRFRYGYTKQFMDFPKPTIRIGRGNPDWGAPTDRDVFIISWNK